MSSPTTSPPAPPAAAEPVRDHLLKCWPEHFEAVWRGEKTHEIRRNDRDYKAGDLVTLAEWMPDSKRATGRWVKGRIGFVTHAGTLGSNVRLPEPLCVFSFQLYARSDP